jgi:hypothetical protein
MWHVKRACAITQRYRRNSGDHFTHKAECSYRKERDSPLSSTVLPQSESESEWLCNSRSVSRSTSILVSSPIWGLWPDIHLFIYCEIFSPVNFGAPSLTRGRVCRLSVSHYKSVTCQYIHINKMFTTSTVLPMNACNSYCIYHSPPFPITYTHACAGKAFCWMLF